MSIEGKVRIFEGSHGEELQCRGYTKLGNIGRDRLKEIVRATEPIMPELKSWDSGGKLYAMIDTNLSLFTRSNRIVEEYFAQYLRDVLVLDEVDIHGASHLVKPFGLRSRFASHQDSTIVEEPTFFSINAWMPFTNIGRLNGCIWVLPGSHIFPNYTRYAGNNPLNTPVVQKELWKKMIPVTFKAGDIFLFHRSLIHGSSGNFLPWQKLRIAVEAVILSKRAPLVVFHRDQDTEKGKIRMYTVEKSHFFENEDPRGALLKESKNYEVMDYKENKQVIEELCQSYGQFKARASRLLPRSNN